MRALNKAWIASGTGNLHKLVFDEVKQRWVLPGHTTEADRKRKAKRDQVSEQCEAISNALASMKLKLHPVIRLATGLVGAAALARRDALLAVEGASPEQQLERLDAVAAVFETRDVSLAPLRFCGDQPLPLAKQLAINAELVQRVEEARAPPGVQTTRAPRTRLTLRAPRRRPNRRRLPRPPTRRKSRARTTTTTITRVPGPKSTNTPSRRRRGA